MSVKNWRLEVSRSPDQLYEIRDRVFLEESSSPSAINSGMFLKALVCYHHLFSLTATCYSSMPYKINKIYKTDGQIPHIYLSRLLDKAAVLPKGTNAAGKWKVCKVTQVEEVKVLTRMIPILLSTILMNTCLAQLQTLSIQQGTLMDIRIGRFDVPSASIPVIPKKLDGTN